ncbi:uncharacterized protein BJ212DRAFT_213029 [Suillus subaureus]|uniref:Uncharacterized protein n=1 Tax=Suillus subaureus TaxID=48587 RepID=A0A9P7EAX6_9AGAM|nr:uncharacterized protein BJ212DRAFT_213029 [Suillus subaureus]KAG1816138.1 hypothetical protein BJ212DRAFT_213029 [Suillus subaureus]
MAAVLRSPATQSPVLAAQHLPPSSTSRASNSSCSHAHSASIPMRRIRFAPLPEPTAQVDDLEQNAIMDTHSRTLSPLSSNTINVQHSAPSNPKPKSSLSRQFNLFKRSSTDPTPHPPQPHDFSAPLSRSASIPSNDSQSRCLSTAPSPSSSQTRPSNSFTSNGDHHAMPKNHFPSPPTPPPLQHAQKSLQMVGTCSTDESTVQNANHSQTSLQMRTMNPSLWNGGTAAWAVSAAAAIQSIPSSPKAPLPCFPTVTPRTSSVGAMMMLRGKRKMTWVHLIQQEAMVMTGVAWHGFANDDKRENGSRGAIRASAERWSSKSKCREVKRNRPITSEYPLELLTYIMRFTI